MPWTTDLLVLQTYYSAFSLRCSPSKFAKLVAATDNEIKDRLRGMGFGGLLEFKPTILDRSLLTWLMDKFNPDTMKLELSSGKEFEINEHRIKTLPKLIQEKLKVRTLAADLAVRSFLRHAFCTLLFSNTDNYIRLDDVVWTKDLDRIGGINWCKELFPHMQLSHRNHCNWCRITVATGHMLYVDYLQHRLDIDQPRLPRCSVLDNRIIDRIAAMDHRGDVPYGAIEYGNLEESIKHLLCSPTCCRPHTRPCARTCLCPICCYSCCWTFCPF
uniref:Aminotransferase-like plant mobile domain-containing protein n=1 Tax=Setaria italica TaxID=4555 RepID=K3YBZ7_SETIT